MYDFVNRNRSWSCFPFFTISLPSSGSKYFPVNLSSIISIVYWCIVGNHFNLDNKSKAFVISHEVYLTLLTKIYPLVPFILTIVPSSNDASRILYGASLILVLIIIKFSVGEEAIVKCLIGPL
jgi:hypothetical protein